MPVYSAHPSYDKYLDQWIRCRDVIDGSDAVKAKTTRYLPKLSSQTKNDYKAYLNRALFFSASARSLQGLVGIMTRKLPIVEQEGLDAYFEDFNNLSQSFYEIHVRLCNELLITGRYGLLIDVPEDGGRAYVAGYPSESIINWSFEGQKLTKVVLKEVIFEEDEKDEFVLHEITQYRVLKLTDGVYTVTVYDVDGNVKSTTMTPLARGKTLSSIPFICLTPQGMMIEPVKPPMIDIVDVNLSHYRSSADLEHGRHVTALPTPVVTGSTSDSPLTIGSQRAWVLPNDKSKAYFLEFTGAGLTYLENALKEKMAQMAQFSARLMDTSTRGSESTDAVRLRYASDVSTLDGILITLEAAYKIVFSYISEFDSVEKPKISVVRDIISSKLSAGEMKAITDAYLAGAIDQETYIYNLKKGEIIPLDKMSFENQP